MTIRNEPTKTTLAVATFTYNPNGLVTKSRDYTGYTGWVDRTSGGTPATRRSYLLANGFAQVIAYERFSDTTIINGSTSTQVQTAPYSPQTYRVSNDTYKMDVALIQRIERALVTTGANPTHWYVTARAEALANLNRRARDKRVSGGESIAEACKTRNMIAQTAKKLASGIRELKKAIKSADSKSFSNGMSKAANAMGFDFSSAKPYYKKSLSNRRRIEQVRQTNPARAERLARKLELNNSKEFSNLWLEFRYGWTPLLSDVYGAMTFTFDYLRARPQIRRVYGRSENAVTSSGYLWNGGESGKTLNESFGATYQQVPVAFHNWKHAYNESESFKLEIGYYLKLKNDGLHGLSQLGLDDPIGLAWDLLPFSFVADWLTNAGDVLAQISNFNGFEFVSGWETYSRNFKINVTIVPVGLRNSGGLAISCQPGSPSSRLRRQTKRVVLTNVQYFGLQFQNGLNLKRVIDAVSLLRQRL